MWKFFNSKKFNEDFNNIESSIGEISKVVTDKERNDLIDQLSKNGLLIRFLPFTIRDDFELANIAIKQNGYALYYLSDRLKNENEIILNAVRSKGKSIVYAGFQTREIFMEAIKNDPSSYEFGKLKYKDEIEFLLQSMKYSNWNMTNCSPRLRNSFQVFNYAIKLPLFSLYFCGSKIKNNKKCVIEALKINTKEFQFASNKIRSNKKFVRKMARIYGNDIYAYASEEIRKNKNL